MWHFAASLSHEVALGQASLALRDLIKKVVVTWDEAAQGHDLAIEGRLEALLELGGAQAVEILPVDNSDTDGLMASLSEADAGEERPSPRTTPRTMSLTAPGCCAP